MAPLYKYKPLHPDQIRLLELFPEERDLVGRIDQYNVETDHFENPAESSTLPKYNAVSHHWDPKPKSTDKSPVLTIKDGGCSFEMPLRPSLAAALEAIREKMRSHNWSHYLWVDAICIDQRSTEDKDKQLPTIGDIYIGALTVIVWLGKLKPDLKRAIHFIRGLQELDQLKGFLNANKHQEDWKSLAMMTRNPWFTRLWIVQEIAAARDAVLLAGDESVSWDEFAGALSLFVSQREAVRDKLAKAGRFARDGNFLGDLKLSAANILIETRGVVLRKRANGDVAERLMSLEALLTSLSMFGVSEAHDTVYAILWLASDVTQGKKRTPAGANHRFNMITPSLAHAKQFQGQCSNVYERHLERASWNSCTDQHSEEDDASWVTAMCEFPHSQPGQTVVFAQEAEQLQANQVLIRETGIKVNYHQPVYELCKQVLEHIIKQRETLDIICYQWAPGPQKKDPDAHPPRFEDEEPHPTWLLHTKKDTYAKCKPGRRYISKAARRVHADPFIGKPGSKPRPYLACGRTRAESVKIEGRVLHAHGYPLAAIAEVGSTALNAVIPFDWRQKLEWTDNLEYPPDRFWRTLVADKGPDGQRPPPRFRLACKWAFQQGADDANLSMEEIRNDGDVQAPLKEFIDCCIPTVWNRKLFLSDKFPNVTESNFVGLGSSEARVGDVICILWGCAVPVLLRPLQTANKAHTRKNKSQPRAGERVGAGTHAHQPTDFTFVGECFVYGMMNGEVFHYVDSHNISLQPFHIH